MAYGEILVRGKGPRLDHVPVLADVGEAIALYLRDDRGTSISRRLFLRLIPPHIGLTGPCSIDHIVRLALAHAGVRPRHRCVAHLFRHSLATRMIRRGASMAEIGEVLRHRSQSTTAIYAKVSFDALRTVARPWPVQRRCPMTLREALVQYVAIRRALGTKLAEPERTLGQFVSFLEREHSSRITTALTLRWAMTPPGRTARDVSSQAIDG